MSAQPAPRGSRASLEATSGRTAELFAEHAQPVLAVCRGMLRDPDEAEDARQQAFLSAHRALAGGCEPRDAAAWLATIARNECRRRLRKRLLAPLTAPAAEAEVAQPALDPIEQVSRRSELHELTSAIARLPERQRDAVLMRAFQGMSYGEVAAAMSISEPAVESLLARARRALGESVRRGRAAGGAGLLPGALREQLARLFPGLEPAEAGVAGATGAGLAKLAALPLGAKLGAAAAVTAASVAVGPTAVSLVEPPSRRDGVTAPPAIAGRVDQSTPARHRHPAKRVQGVTPQEVVAREEGETAGGRRGRDGRGLSTERGAADDGRSEESSGPSHPDDNTRDSGGGTTGSASSGRSGDSDGATQTPPEGSSSGPGTSGSDDDHVEAVASSSGPGSSGSGDDATEASGHSSSSGLGSSGPGSTGSGQSSTSDVGGSGSSGSGSGSDAADEPGN